jgi:hypothetical protein
MSASRVSASRLLAITDQEVRDHGDPRAGRGIDRDTYFGAHEGTLAAY